MAFEFTENDDNKNKFHPIEIGILHLMKQCQERLCLSVASYQYRRRSMSRMREVCSQLEIVFEHNDTILRSELPPLG